MKLCLCACTIFTFLFAGMFSFLWLMGGKCHLILWCVCGNHSILTGWHHVFQSLGTWIDLVSETRLLSNLSGNKLKHAKNAEVSFHMKSKEFASLLCREIIFMWQPSLLIVSLVNIQTPVAMSSMCDVMWCVSASRKKTFPPPSLYTRSVNKVMRLIQYNSVLTFKLQIEFVPFKIVPLGGYTPPETLFPLFIATLVVANRNRF